MSRINLVAGATGRDRGALFCVLFVALSVVACFDPDVTEPKTPGWPAVLEWSSHEGPLGGSVNGIMAVQGSVLAVAPGDGIYRSDDGGSSWTLLSSYPADPPWTEPLAITECDGEVLIAVGGRVVRSADRGDSWEEVWSEAMWALANSGRTVLGVEFDGSTYISGDCGGAWEAKGQAASIAQSAAHVEGSTWLVASQTAGVDVTDDDGQTWRPSLNLPGASTAFVSSAGRAFGAARTGGFFRSDDLSEWVALPGLEPGWPAFVEFLAEPVPGLLYHAYDVMLSRSTDNGTTWERLAWMASDRIAGLTSLDGSLYVGAEDGVWRRTGDEPPVLIGPRRLSPESAGVMAGGTPFIGARSGPLAATVYVSTGGAWSQGLFRETLLADWVESGSLGLLLGLRSIEEPGLGRIVRTTDGGTSWATVLQGVEPGALLVRDGVAFAFVDALMEMTPGEGQGGVWRSANGASWEQVAELPVAAPYEARGLAALPGRGLALLVDRPDQPEGTELWLLQDDGTWRTHQLPGGQATLGIGSLPGARLIAVGTASIHVSDDAGASWTATTRPDNAGISDIATGAGYVAIATDQGLYGSDDGSSWRRIHPDAFAFTSVGVAADGTVVATAATDVYVGRSAQ